MRTIERVTVLDADVGRRAWRPRLTFGLGGSPAQGGFARSSGLVQTPHVREVWRILDEFWVVHGLLLDGFYCTDECVQRLLGLGFGRLDHQGSPHHERKVHGRRVKPIVDEAL